MWKLISAAFVVLLAFLWRLSLKVKTPPRPILAERWSKYMNGWSDCPICRAGGYGNHCDICNTRLRDKPV